MTAAFVFRLRCMNIKGENFQRGYFQKETYGGFQEVLVLAEKHSGVC